MTDKSQTSQNVAALHDDSAPADTAEPAVSEASLPEYEAEAVRHLQRGLGKESIIKRLTDSGLSRATATMLTDKVWQEHSGERRMNAYILLGVALLLLLISAGLLAPRVLSGESLPTMSVLYLLMGLAAWFIIKALRDLRGTGAN
jgi:hypothetical protein